MIEPKLTKQEELRLQTLNEYHIMDSLEEDDYDNLTAIASQICGTHISLVSLVDDKRQWFKSHYGLDASETPKNIAFCAHAIANPDEVLIVNDSRKDDRFFDNPLVTDHPHVIFYAGVPLIGYNGQPLGTLCVIDDKPKELSKMQISSLKSLAKQVINLMELKRNKGLLEASILQLKEKNKEVERFAYLAAHDLKSPLRSIGVLSNMLIDESSKNSDLNPSQISIIKKVETSVNYLHHMVDGLLNHCQMDQIDVEEKSNVSVKTLLEELTTLVGEDLKVNIQITTNLKELQINHTTLSQVLLNLIYNGIKYNKEDIPTITISVIDEGGLYSFEVKDNGIGIPEIKLPHIFEIFNTASGGKDRFGNKGTGIGLATVKKMINNCGGSIEVESKEGEGSTFKFTMAK